jgi:hypothetical protein
MRLWTQFAAFFTMASVWVAPSALWAQVVEPNPQPLNLKMNQIQAVGTHKSYKIAILNAEMAPIRRSSQAAATSLDYGHLQLNQQLDLGMRQLELDVLYDPQGGRYSRPALARMTRGRPGASNYDASQMARLSYKVLHAQDVDVRTHCPTFIMCLTQIDAWSKAHADHAPLLIQINAKDGKSSVPFRVKALDYDSVAFAALDLEIRIFYRCSRKAL